MQYCHDPPPHFSRRARARASLYVLWKFVLSIFIITVSDDARGDKGGTAEGGGVRVMRGRERHDDDDPPVDIPDRA